MNVCGHRLLVDYSDAANPVVVCTGPERHTWPFEGWETLARAINPDGDATVDVGTAAALVRRNRTTITRMVASGKVTNYGSEQRFRVRLDDVWAALAGVK